MSKFNVGMLGEAPKAGGKRYVPKASKPKAEPAAVSAAPESDLRKVSGIKSPLIAKNKQSAVTALHPPKKNQVHGGIAKGFHI